jgi:hypothetical protein
METGVKLIAIAIVTFFLKLNKDNTTPIRRAKKIPIYCEELAMQIEYLFYMGRVSASSRGL